MSGQDKSRQDSISQRHVSFSSPSHLSFSSVAPTRRRVFIPITLNLCPCNHRVSSTTSATTFQSCFSREAKSASQFVAKSSTRCLEPGSRCSMRAPLSTKYRTLSSHSVREEVGLKRPYRVPWRREVGHRACRLIYSALSERPLLRVYWTPRFFRPRVLVESWSSFVRRQSDLEDVLWCSKRHAQFGTTPLALCKCRLLLS